MLCFFFWGYELVVYTNTFTILVSKRNSQRAKIPAPQLPKNCAPQCRKWCKGGKGQHLVMNDQVEPGFGPALRVSVIFERLTVGEMMKKNSGCTPEPFRWGRFLENLPRARCLREISSSISCVGTTRKSKCQDSRLWRCGLKLRNCVHPKFHVRILDRFPPGNYITYPT